MPKCRNKFHYQQNKNSSSSGANWRQDGDAPGKPLSEGKKGGFSIRSASVSGYSYISYRKLRHWKRQRNERDDNSTERATEHATRHRQNTLHAPADHTAAHNASDQNSIHSAADFSG
jgi:hypothetical protein